MPHLMENVMKLLLDKGLATFVRDIAEAAGKAGITYIMISTEPSDVRHIAELAKQVGANYVMVHRQAFETSQMGINLFATEMGFRTIVVGDVRMDAYHPRQLVYDFTHPLNELVELLVRERETL